ncbi:MAG: SUMF1/EgtB/PvdO family nonheme iron enzyme [Caldilineaceae bacterium]|nr:SUMF1/EgtB/PvdO family nonheme iron enzyme [Caldilineaceae bacterium]
MQRRFLFKLMVAAATALLAWGMYLVWPWAPPSSGGYFASTASAQGCTNRATFVADVTVPDDSIFLPGEAFEKTWRVRNTGSCTWSTSYVVRFESGSRLGAASSYRLTRSVPPNSTYDITVPMTAPSTAGTYTSSWRLRPASGASFGARLYTRIIVSDPTLGGVLPSELAFGGWGGASSCDMAPPRTSSPVIEWGAPSYTMICFYGFPTGQRIYLHLYDPSGREYSQTIVAGQPVQSRDDAGSYATTTASAFLRWWSGVPRGTWWLEAESEDFRDGVSIQLSDTWIDTPDTSGPYLTIVEPNPFHVFDFLFAYAPGQRVTVRGANMLRNRSVPVGVYSSDGLVDGLEVTANAQGRFEIEVPVQPGWAEGLYMIAAIARPSDLEYLPDSGTYRFEGPAVYLLVVERPPVSDEGPPVSDDQPPVGGVTPVAPDIEFVEIPAGNFYMGSTEAELDEALRECNATEGNCKAEWFASEPPQRRIYLDSFAIGKYEVTYEQYAACVDAGVCRTPGVDILERDRTFESRYFQGDHPVVGVTWYDASTYCEWIGGRLPTEEEWEKAARGTDTRRYPWGSSYRSGYANLGTGRLTVVGGFYRDASPYGVQDMAGNVVEWTQTPDRNRYVLHGGGFDSFYFRGRVTDRGTKLEPDFANYDIGFRCVAQ